MFDALKILPPALLIALWSAGCFVPTIDELDQQKVWACDDTHACPDGFDCDEGSCKPREGAACSPGETGPCGTETGACELGVRHCGDDGTFGACEGAVGAVPELCNGLDDDCDGDTDEELTATACELSTGVCAGAVHACVGGTLEAVCGAASYGAAWEAGAELTCDDVDNDCDGQVDEGLSIGCPRQLGVCANASAACVKGAFAECTDETYLQHDGRYEQTEASCDGADNDCDGLPDRGAPVHLSQSSGAGPRIAAAPMPGGKVMVLYPEGGKIRAQPVDAAGQVAGPGVYPAITVEVATAAFSPALASDGGNTFAAWIEEFLPGSFRVMVARLGDDGRSVLTNGSGDALASPVSSLACLSPGSTCTVDGDCCSNSCASGTCATSGTPRIFTSVDLTVANDKLYVMLVETGATPQARGAVLSTQLPPTSGVNPVTFLTGEVTGASIRGSSEGVFAAVATFDGIDVFEVAPTGEVTPNGALAMPGARLPQIVPTVQGEAMLYATTGDGMTILAATCTSADCTQTASTDVGPDSVKSLRVSGTDAASTLIAWAQGASGGPTRGFVTRQLGTPPPSLPLGGGESLAVEPLVVDAGGRLHAVWTDGDDAFTQWTCAPP